MSLFIKFELSPGEPFLALRIPEKDPQLLRNFEFVLPIFAGTTKGETISGARFICGSERRSSFTVLVTGEPHQTILDNIKIADWFVTQLNCDVVLWDYPPNGDSKPGNNRPDAAMFRRSLEAVHAFIGSDFRIKDTKLVLYGFGFGSSLTLEFRANKQFHATVLDSPLTSCTECPGSAEAGCDGCEKVKNSLAEKFTPTFCIHGDRSTRISTVMFSEFFKDHQNIVVEGKEHEPLYSLCKDAIKNFIWDPTGEHKKE